MIFLGIICELVQLSLAGDMLVPVVIELLGGDFDGLHAVRCAADDIDRRRIEHRNIIAFLLTLALQLNYNSLYGAKASGCALVSFANPDMSLRHTNGYEIIYRRTGRGPRPSHERDARMR